MRNVDSFRAGDIVEVNSPSEILETLDADGTFDRLPFMPEMIDSCGKRFRVAKRVLKTCSYTGNGTNMREFSTDDVVTLEDVRCSGAEHDGCPKACMIFWRTAWLRKVTDTAAPSAPDPSGADRLRARLRTKAGPRTYFCQASELLRATAPLSRWHRIGRCISDVRAGNCTLTEMVRYIAIWLLGRTRRRVFGEYGCRHNQATPVTNLDLQAGEWIEVRPMQDIVKTLSATGHNRGLYFTPDMRLHCGDRHRVAQRLDKIICDGTGEMRSMRNTVYLEGSLCSCAHVAFGGCPRNEFVYWREIWLRRLNPSVCSSAEPGVSSTSRKPESVRQ